MSPCQAHREAVFQVDGGKQDHAGLTMRANSGLPFPEVGGWRILAFSGEWVGHAARHYRRHRAAIVRLATIGAVLGPKLIGGTKWGMRPVGPSGMPSSSLCGGRRAYSSPCGFSAPGRMARSCRPVRSAQALGHHILRAPRHQFRPTQCRERPAARTVSSSAWTCGHRIEPAPRSKRTTPSTTLRASTSSIARHYDGWSCPPRAARSNAWRRNADCPNRNDDHLQRLG